MRLQEQGYYETGFVVLIGQQPTVTILIEQHKCNMSLLCLT